MNMNILAVVLDQAALLLKKQIEEHGSTLVVHSFNYREVVELVNYHKPDIIIIDISIEPFNQENVLKELMLISTKSKFIVVSDYFSEEQRLKLFRIGIDSFIQKPFQPADLWEKLDSMKLTLEKEISTYQNYEGREGYYKKLNYSIKNQIKSISKNNDGIAYNSKEEDFIFEFDDSEPSYNTNNTSYMGLPKYIDKENIELSDETADDKSLSKRNKGPLSKIKGVLRK